MFRLSDMLKKWLTGPQKDRSATKEYTGSLQEAGWIMLETQEL